MRPPRPGAFFAVLALTLLVTAPAFSQSFLGAQCPGVQFPLRGTGTQVLTVGTTAVGITLALATSAMAVVTIETNPVRFRDDAVNPTATTGTFWAKASATFQNPLVVCGGAVGTIKFVQDTTATGSATATVNLYGP